MENSNISDKKKIIIKWLIIAWYIFLGIMTFGRIVISSGYIYDYIPTAGMDDRWMVNTAYTLLGRQWMGAYSHVTLIKSLTYPFMLAGFRAFGIPYGIGVGLLIVFISLVTARAFRPEVKNDVCRGILYLVVLYSPFGFMTITSGRIYRNSISHWLALFVMASIIGMYYRRDWPFRKCWKWILCSAVSLMMFWELREDHIWILAFVLPAYVILFIYYVFHKKGFFKTCIVLLIPIIATVLMEVGIASINYHVYGVFTTNDRTGTYCGKVMSLLYQIDDGNEHRYDIWLPKGALELARETSPTLDSIGPHLEADWGFWQIDTEYGVEAPGDHSEWAIRQAVFDAGYYKDAVSTNEFYKKVYNELEEGFESGKLKKKEGITLSSQMKAFDDNDIEMAWGLTDDVIKKYSTYDFVAGAYVAYTTSGMYESDKEFFESMLLMNIVEYYPVDTLSEAEGLDVQDYTNSLYGAFILNRLNDLWRIYQRFAAILNYVSIATVLLMVGFMIYELRRKEFYSLYAFMITVGIFLVLVAYTYMICLWGLWMTTDPTSSVYWFYGSPGPMLAQLFRILCVVYLGNMIVRIYRKRRIVKEKED